MNKSKNKNKLNHNTCILAIDPGTVKLGFAIYKDGDLLSEQFYIKDYGQKNQISYNEDSRLLIIKKRVEQLIIDYGVQQIVCEIPVKYHVTISTFHQIIGIIRYLSSKYNLFVMEEMSPSEAKKAMTGYGRSDKNAMKHGVSSFLGNPINGLQEDETDAIAILITYLKRIGLMK